MTGFATALVTGGAGFVGSHLVERLLAAGCSVTVLDDFNSFYDPAIKRRNLEEVRRRGTFHLVEGDLLEPSTLERAWKRGPFDAVFHLAARAGVRPSIAEPLLYERVNVEGTLLLLEKVRRNQATRFVFASSSSVYGASADPPFHEDAGVGRPLSPYAGSKRAGELHAYTYHHLYGIPVTCLRLFTVHGPRQRPEMAIHAFVRAVESGRPIEMFGEGASARDYTYVDDAVEGFLRAAERTGGYEVINIGNSRTVRLDELVEMVGIACGRTPRVHHRPVQAGDVPLTCADLSKARSLLGYEPRVPLEEGLRRFVEWYRRNPVPG